MTLKRITKKIIAKIQLEAGVKNGKDEIISFKLDGDAFLKIRIILLYRS